MADESPKVEEDLDDLSGHYDVYLDYLENVHAVNDPVENAVNDPVENAVNDPVENAVNDPVENAVNDPVENAVNDPVENAVNDPVENDNEGLDEGNYEVDSAEDSEVDSAEDSDDLSGYYDAYLDYLENVHVENVVNNPVENAVNNPVENAVNNPVENAVNNPVENANEELGEENSEVLSAEDSEVLSAEDSEVAISEDYEITVTRLPSEMRTYYYCIKLNVEMQGLTDLQPVNGVCDMQMIYVFKVKCLLCDEVFAEPLRFQISKSPEPPSCDSCGHSGYIHLVGGHGRVAKINGGSTTLVLVRAFAWEPVDCSISVSGYWRARLVCSGKCYYGLLITEGVIHPLDYDFDVVMSGERSEIKVHGFSVEEVLEPIRNEYTYFDIMISADMDGLYDVQPIAEYEMLYEFQVLCSHCYLHRSFSSYLHELVELKCSTCNRSGTIELLPGYGDPLCSSELENICVVECNGFLPTGATLYIKGYWKAKSSVSHMNVKRIDISDVNFFHNESVKFDSDSEADEIGGGWGKPATSDSEADEIGGGWSFGPFSANFKPVTRQDYFNQWYTMPVRNRKLLQFSGNGDEVVLQQRTGVKIRVLPWQVCPFGAVQMVGTKRSDIIEAEKLLKQLLFSVGPQMSIVVTGKVASRKSTMTGLLTSMLAEDFEGIAGRVGKDRFLRFEKKAAEINRRSFKYAWVMDILIDKYACVMDDGGHTIDYSLAKFQLDPLPGITVIDVPGDGELIENLITAISQADCALLAVDWTDKVSNFDVVREHAFLAFNLGRQIICCVTKINAVTPQYSEYSYKKIVSDVSKCLEEAGFDPPKIDFVPMSLSGSLDDLPWYTGPTLIEALARITVPGRPLPGKPLRLPILNVFMIPDIGPVCVGRVESGCVEPGMPITLGPKGVTGEVMDLTLGPAQTIDEIKSDVVDGEVVKQATPGVFVAFSLKNVEVVDLKRGYVASNLNDDPAKSVASFVAEVTIVNLSGKLRKGYTAMMYCHTLHAEVEFVELLTKSDKQSGVIEDKPEYLEKGESGMVKIIPKEPIVVESFNVYPSLGRFIMRDMHQTVCYGVIKSVVKEEG